jgi:hypothetical protein
MQTVKINGVEFTPLPGVRYAHDYVGMSNKIREVAETEGEDAGVAYAEKAYRYLFLNDLFFIVYFVEMKPQTPEQQKMVNHPFVVNACQEVEEGPSNMTLDVWAREHFKSTIITRAETLQFLAREPEEGACIISATRGLAKDFLRSLMNTMQAEGPFLKQIFPEGPFWFNPLKEAKLWSVNEGCNLDRNSKDPTPSLYAAGLEEGMPTGKHFKRLIFDDIVNADIARSSQRMADLKVLYDVAQDVGKEGGHVRVVGTFYHYADPLVYIRDKKRINSEEFLYHHRVKPATDDGEPNGKPVLISQETLDVKKTQKTYYTQQLCNPVPESTRKIPGRLLKDIKHQDIPMDIIKVMPVDPAGKREDGRGDNWAIAVIGIEPNADDLGASNFYIMDLFLDRIDEAQAPMMVAQMYKRNGLITMLGVEKVGLATAEIHIANALRESGVELSVKAKNLMTLNPAKRSKEARIETALAWPLYNGKVFISDRVPVEYRDRLREELDSFPFGATDDGIDDIAYGLRDMLLNETVKGALMSYAPQKHIDLYGDNKLVLKGGSSWMSR